MHPVRVWVWCWYNLQTAAGLRSGNPAAVLTWATFETCPYVGMGSCDSCQAPCTLWVVVELSKAIAKCAGANAPEQPFLELRLPVHIN